jgi:hypothetical protein
VITGLDHVVVLLENIEAGAKAYELLLGRAPSWRSRTGGAETVLFTLDNRPQAGDAGDERAGRHLRRSHAAAGAHRAGIICV